MAGLASWLPFGPFPKYLQLDDGSKIGPEKRNAENIHNKAEATLGCWYVSKHIKTSYEDVNQVFIVGIIQEK